jgi:hypothetical protein
MTPTFSWTVTLSGIMVDLRHEAPDNAGLAIKDSPQDCEDTDPIRDRHRL